jgi:hypothetical protein
MKLNFKSGDEVVILGVNFNTENFSKDTLVMLQKQNYPVTVKITQFGFGENSFETPVEWYKDFDPGTWTLEFFYFIPYFNEGLKYLL